MKAADDAREPLKLAPMIAARPRPGHALFYVAHFVRHRLHQGIAGFVLETRHTDRINPRDKFSIGLTIPMPCHAEDEIVRMWKTPPSKGRGRA